MKTYIHKQPHTRIFKAALFTVALDSKLLTQSVEEQIHQKTEYYSVVRRNQLVTMYVYES